MSALQQVPSFARDDVLGITLLPQLTDRQLAVLRTIHTQVQATKCYPTQREIAGQLGYSQATTLGHINALVKKGYLARDIDTHSRNIRLTVLAIEKLRGEPQLELI